MMSPRESAWIQRRDRLGDPPLVLAVPARALLERQSSARHVHASRAVDAVDLHASRLDQRRRARRSSRSLPVPALAELGGEHEQRPAVVTVREQRAPGRARGRCGQAQARRSRSARWGWSASRHAIQLCASRFHERAHVPAAPLERLGERALLSWFSSARPHVNFVGMGGAKPLRPFTCPTKRVIRAKREKRCSWLSKRRRKKLPDWRNRPASEPGVEEVRVQRRERAEARAHQHGRAVRRRLLADGGQQVGRERVRVARGRRIRLVPIRGRRQERGAQLGHLAEVDEVVEQTEQRRVVRVLRSVVDDEQRQRPCRIGVRGRPEQRRRTSRGGGRSPAAARGARPGLRPRRRPSPAWRSPGTRSRSSRRTAPPPAAGCSDPAAPRSCRPGG